MVEESEYRVLDVYPGSQITWPGRLHIDQGHGALMKPSGEATVWKNEDLQGGLVVTKRVMVTEPKIETGNITTCCIASAQTTEGEKMLVHARSPRDMSALLGYGLDQAHGAMEEVVLENRAPESTQQKYTDIASGALHRRGRHTRVTHRRGPEKFDLGNPYSAKI